MPEDNPIRSRSGSQKRKKLHMVTTAYDPAEFAELDEAASRAGMTRASYQRVQSLAQPKTRSTRRAPIDRELLAKLLGQFGKAASNLNQAVAFGHVGKADRAEVMATVADLRGLLPDLMTALGRRP